MTIYYVGGSGTNGLAGTFSFTPPAGSQPGDLIIVTLFSYAGGATATPPAGFAYPTPSGAPSYPYSDGPAAAIFKWYKFYESGDTTYTFTMTDYYFSAVMDSYRGVDTTTPFLLGVTDMNYPGPSPFVVNAVGGTASSGEWYYGTVGIDQSTKSGDATVTGLTFRSTDGYNFYNLFTGDTSVNTRTVQASWAYPTMNAAGSEVYILKAAAGAYNGVITESITPSETLLVTGRSLGMAESVSASDTAAANLIVYPSISESATPSDNITVGYKASVSDSATATDAITPIYEIAITEHVAVTESLTESYTAWVSIAESATATDAVEPNGVFSVNISESTSATDTVGKNAIFPVTISETTSASSVVSGIYQVFVSDSATASEIVAAAISVTVTESVTSSDLITPQYMFQQSILEVAAASESLGASSGYGGLFDHLTAYDAVYAWIMPPSGANDLNYRNWRDYGMPQWWGEPH